MVYHNSQSIKRKLDPIARQNFISMCSLENVLSWFNDSMLSDAMNKYDPNEIFMNKFGLRLKGEGTKQDIDPKTIHCALLDNCFCTKNSDCGSTQTCTTLRGYTYRVCKTRNEIPEYSFDSCVLPPPLGILSYLVEDIPTLVIAAISNCSLTDAIGTVGLLLPGLLPVDNILESVGTLAGQLGQLGKIGGLLGAVGGVLGGVLNG